MLTRLRIDTFLAEAVLTTFGMLSPAKFIKLWNGESSAEASAGATSTIYALSTYNRYDGHTVMDRDGEGDEERKPMLTVVKKW